jgi:hypothetical protein
VGAAESLEVARRACGQVAALLIQGLQRAGYRCALAELQVRVLRGCARRQMHMKEMQVRSKPATDRERRG